MHAVAGNAGYFIQPLKFGINFKSLAKTFCKRGLYLRDGELAMDGPIADVIGQYDRDTGTYVDRSIDDGDDVMDDVSGELESEMDVIV